MAEPGKLQEEVDELAERLATIGQTRHGYLGVVKESLNRSLWPHLDDDLRMQLVGHRLSDLYRLHPYEPSVD